MTNTNNSKNIIHPENVIHTDSSIYYNHIIGNKDYTEGWCGDIYPKQCECGRLIHADFGNENFDGDYWLYTKCDKYGESE